MKKLLLLIPLLAACAPSISKPLDSIGPFKVGQTIKLSSVSKTDKALPPTSVFTIKNIETDRADRESYIIQATSLAGGTRTTVYALFNAQGSLFIVTDSSTFAVGAAKQRLCVFSDIDLNRSPYPGFAGHLTQDELASGTKTLDSSLNKNQSVSSMARAQAAVQTLAPEDNGPCTLELVQ